MPIARLALCVTTAMMLSVAPVQAQGRGHGNSHPITSHGSPQTVAATTHGSPHATAPTTKAHGSPHASTQTTHGGNHATAAKPHGSQKKTATPSAASSGSSTATGGTTTPGGTGSSTTTTLNPLAQKISSHPQLASKLKAMLPSGMTLNDASAGFRNQGQFIAALHVSQNLNIPFADLKAAMLGTPKPASTPTPSTPGTAGTTTTTTDNSPMSLGQAIKKLRPSASANDEITQAQRETEVDLLSSPRSGRTTRRSTSSGSVSSTGATGSTTGTTPTTATTQNPKHGK